MVKAAEREISGFRALSRELIWIGCGKLTQAAVVVSYLQHKTPWLTVGNMVDEKALLKEMKDFPVDVVLISPPTGVFEATVTTLWDADFNISPRQSYGQT